MADELPKFETKYATNEHDVALETIKQTENTQRYKLQVEHNKNIGEKTSIVHSAIWATALCIVVWLITRIYALK